MTSLIGNNVESEYNGKIIVAYVIIRRSKFTQFFSFIALPVKIIIMVNAQGFFEVQGL